MTLKNKETLARIVTLILNGTVFYLFRTGNFENNFLNIFILLSLIVLPNFVHGWYSGRLHKEN